MKENYYQRTRRYLYLKKDECNERRKNYKSDKITKEDVYEFLEGMKYKPDKIKEKKKEKKKNRKKNKQKKTVEKISVEKKRAFEEWLRTDLQLSQTHVGYFSQINNHSQVHTFLKFFYNINKFFEKKGEKLFQLIPEFKAEMQHVLYDTIAMYSTFKNEYANCKRDKYQGKNQNDPQIWGVVFNLEKMKKLAGVSLK